eukprot:TRINITY_DN7031_c0_g1_i1.p1 TRINITY_DN7031_c0_g1~~TRINITY_DN7031_c0_g1_i1.p1  ORF type:complete len:605 (+),score=232.85 TRINITY_DN7031_c0_g1_i1:42-1856(+)
MESGSHLNDKELVALSKNFVPTKASCPSLPLKARFGYQNQKSVHFTPLSPIQFLARAVNVYPNKLAVAHPFGNPPVFYSYAQLGQRAVNLAWALKSVFGIKEGEVVAILTPNTPLILEAHFGIPLAKAILHPINSRLSSQDIEYVLQHSLSRVLLVDRTLLSQVENLQCIKDGSVKVVVSEDNGREDCQYESFLTEGRKAAGEKEWESLDLVDDEDKGIALCYTSGTTGRPKGVLTTHRGAYLASLSNVIEGRLNLIHSDPVYLWTLPLFHASGWTFPWAVTAAFGCHLILRTIEYDKIWDCLNRFGVTHYCAAPTVQIGLVNHPKARKMEGRQVTTIVAASAPTAVLLESLEKLGIFVVHVYGLTETYGPTVKGFRYPFWQNLSVKDRSFEMSKQGQNYIASDEVKVIRVLKEDDGKVIPFSPIEEVPWDGKTLGEVVMRGNIVMKEYFRNESATKEAFQDGWFHSGDLAVRHPNGAIAIADRSKDIIISGGENISSLEVESALSKHPDVLEVCVVARIDTQWGERPMAYVLLKEDQRKKWRGKEQKFEEELKAFSRKVLSGFKRPHWVKVVDQLPKTSTGKIQKFVLRKMAAEEKDEPKSKL